MTYLIQKIPLCLISLLALGFTFFFNPGAKAQNLAFSRVVLVSSTTDTVPAGKVWKVVNVIPPEIYTFGSNNAPLQFEVFVNGNSRKIGHAAWTDSNQNSTSPTHINVPFWLPAGTSLRAGLNTGEISIIEFNTTP